MNTQTWLPRLLAGAVFTAVLGGGSAGNLLAADSDQVRVSSEYKIKGAFIYNFTKFIRWASEAEVDSMLVVGVFASEGVVGSLESVLAEAQVAGTPIRIERQPTPGVLPPHSVLFVAADHEEEARPFLESVYGSSVLLVGESERFLARGGVISFVMHRNKVRFAVNLDGAERQGIRLSSKLLSVASEVIQRSPGKAARQ